jgi:hypothetical protein
LIFELSWVNNSNPFGRGKIVRESALKVFSLSDERTKLYQDMHSGGAIGESGHDIIVFGYLSTGHNWAVLYGKLEVRTLEDSSYLESGN